MRMLAYIHRFPMFFSRRRRKKIQKSSILLRSRRKWLAYLDIPVVAKEEEREGEGFLQLFFREKDSYARILYFRSKGQKN